MAVATMLSGTVHQALDLALGEVAPLDCQVYDAWCAFLGCRFHADKLCLCISYCICYTSFLHSRKGTQASPRRQIGGPARGVAQPRMGMPLNRQGGRVRAPLGGGRAKIENSSRRHPRKFGQKRFLVVREVAGEVSGVACFGLPPWKKFSAERRRLRRRKGG